MLVEIRWLRKALNNLDSHANHIATKDPATAQKAVQRVYDAVGLLMENPALGHPGRIEGTRELVVPGTRFIIPYRVMSRQNRIEILRVSHSSQEPPVAW